MSCQEDRKELVGNRSLHRRWDSVSERLRVGRWKGDPITLPETPPGGRPEPGTRRSPEVWFGVRHTDCYPTDPVTNPGRSERGRSGPNLHPGPSSRVDCAVQERERRTDDPSVGGLYTTTGVKDVGVDYTGENSWKTFGVGGGMWRVGEGQSKRRHRVSSQMCYREKSGEQGEQRWTGEVILSPGSTPSKGDRPPDDT